MIKGRAETAEAKRKLVAELLAMWLRCPHLRLGQLIDGSTPDDQSVFFVEDAELLENAKLFLRKLNVP